jgi:hypothetical protein
MAGPGRGPEKSKRWLAIESAVAVLEAGLAPGARVQHNVTLLQPGTKTRRQCDVVITSGGAPRETRTIVEVQARKKKVGIAQFQSWVRKQEQLQVQHLICVSTSGFTRSVQREAEEMGDRVRLLTLLPGGRPPRWEVDEIQEQMEILLHRDTEIIFDKSIPVEANARVDAPVFRWERSRQFISIMDIAEVMLMRGEALGLKVMHTVQNTSRREFSLSFTGLGSRVWLPTASGEVPVCEANVTDQLEQRVFTTPIEVLSYAQFRYEGELGWVILGSGEYEGRAFHSRMVVLPDGLGGLRISRSRLIGPDNLITDGDGSLELIVGQPSHA